MKISRQKIGAYVSVQSSGTTADIVFDMLGGDALNRSFKVLKNGGTLVSIKGQDTDGLAVMHGVRFEWFFMEPDGTMLADLAMLMENGIVRPVTDRVYPISDTNDAYAALKDGHAVGKIVVSVDRE